MKEALPHIFLLFLITTLISANIEVTIKGDGQEFIQRNFNLQTTKRSVNQDVYEIDQETLQKMRNVFGGTMKRYNKNPPCGYNTVQCAARHGDYTDYETLTMFLNETARSYPDITRMFTIGKSSEGRELWGIEISDKPGDQSEFEPNFKYIGNMHGDEVVGRENLIKLIGLLTESYGNDDRLTKMVNDTHIFIIPSMNPDGFERCQRENARGKDLNRNFPDQFNDDSNTYEGREVETVAMMKFVESLPFTLSANFHGGDMVVNYPYDGCSNCHGGNHLSLSDDTDIFRNVSRGYADFNLPMKANNDQSFENGITSGAMWYVLFGGMQDWNYVYSHCMEVTIELSCDKMPAGSELEQFWLDNRESMLVYIESVHMGIRGHVTDTSGNALVAEITIQDRDFTVLSDSLTGKYFRMALPGNYIITAKYGSTVLEQEISIGANELNIIVDFEFDIATTTSSSSSSTTTSSSSSTTSSSTSSSDSQDTKTDFIDITTETEKNTDSLTTVLYVIIMVFVVLTLGLLAYLYFKKKPVAEF